MQEILFLAFHCRLIIPISPDPVVDIGKKDAEEWTEHIKESIGKVMDRRYAKNP